MLSTRTTDIEGSLAQIKSLTEAGCDLVRLAVPDEKSAEAFKEIAKRAGVPLIADIHYSYKLAMLALDAGAKKIRTNPGNMRDDRGLKELAKRLSDEGIPVRVGVNGGSLDPRFKGMREEEALVASKQTDYPLHLGVTEAGTLRSGLVKSALGIGTLLEEGIGDTVRISLSAPPIEEVLAGKTLLRALGLRRDSVEVVSCPTCARTEIDVEKLANAVERATAHIRLPLKIAVMGCPLNGIGEGEGSDLGVAGGKEKSVIMKEGRVVETVPTEMLIPHFMSLVDEYIAEYSKK